MAVERPTFHESWYRIKDLSPRLLSSVHVYRQHFRGQLWYILENPSTNEFSRLSQQGYHFIALLDGQMSVAEAWSICNQQMGDEAPTQGEVIQLLGQLYTTNLLYAELPADTKNLLNRYQMRFRRRIQGYVTNLLFMQIPLLDPDNFLDRWVGLVGRVFSRVGIFIWSILIITALFYIIANFQELIYQSRDVLAPDNLIWLYLSLVFVKVIHEFSHAFACKKFGKMTISGGQVHNMGIMFLVFIPLPYVDASSSWALRSKWHRAIIGLAGIYAELFIAAVATIFWASTSTGTLHIIAYNIIFVAGVSTLFFNGNPLLRYDAYYVLSDIIEIPNLTQRSVRYIYYLGKRYAWDLKKTPNPANSQGEKIWFTFYGAASTCYRIFISIRILIFLNKRLPEELFIAVPFLAISAVVMWAIIPLGRFFRYLSTGAELARNRPRAIWSTVAVMSAIIFVFGILPVHHHIRLEGVVEPVDLAVVYAKVDGLVDGFSDCGIKADVNSTVLMKSTNPKLEAEHESLLAEKRGMEAKWRLAQTKEPAAAVILSEQLKAIDDKIERVESQLETLNLTAPITGIWVPSDLEKKDGTYVLRGQKVGLVGTLDKMRIRAVAGQAVAAMLIEEPCKELEIRVKKRPHRPIDGTIENILPAGLDILPAQALGYAIGGSTPTAAQDRYGLQAAEKFFEVRILPEENSEICLLSGQRVVSRIRLPSKPLAVQWWTSLRQLFQRRYRI